MLARVEKPNRILDLYLTLRISYQNNKQYVLYLN